MIEKKNTKAGKTMILLVIYTTWTIGLNTKYENSMWMNDKLPKKHKNL